MARFRSRSLPVKTCHGAERCGSRVEGRFLNLQPPKRAQAGGRNSAIVQESAPPYTRVYLCTLRYPKMIFPRARSPGRGRHKLSGASQVCGGAQPLAGARAKAPEDWRPPACWRAAEVVASIDGPQLPQAPAPRRPREQKPAVATASGEAAGDGSSAGTGVNAVRLQGHDVPVVPTRAAYTRFLREPLHWGFGTWSHPQPDTVQPQPAATLRKTLFQKALDRFGRQRVRRRTRFDRRGEGFGETPQPTGGTPGPRNRRTGSQPRPRRSQARFLFHAQHYSRRLGAISGPPGKNAAKCQARSGIQRHHGARKGTHGHENQMKKGP